MKHTKISTIVKRSLSFAGMGVILAGLVVGDLYYAKYEPLISEAFFGVGTNFEGEEVQEAFAASDNLAQQIEAEGVVMLKNKDGQAPLKSVDKVNLFGWSSSPSGWIRNSDGSNASAVSKDKTKNLTDALASSGIGYNQELIDMYTNFRSKRSGIRALTGNEKFFMLIEPSAEDYKVAQPNGSTLLDDAKSYSDTAIVVLGRLGGEGTDLPFKQYLNTTGTYEASDANMPTDDTRNYLQISQTEQEMLEMVEENFSNVVVLINSCNAMQLDFLKDDRIGSAYLVGGTGQSGAVAIPKILKGEINPSGRTTDTYVYDQTSNPSYQNAAKMSANSGYIVYQEGIYVGYKWYETADASGYYQQIDNEYGKGYDGIVQYPFGYGLSYSSFDWKLESPDGLDPVSPAIGSQLAKNDEISVSVKVTNTGSASGKDVVEIYYAPQYYAGGIEKSSVNLAAFAKTTSLDPGKSQYLTLKFKVSDMASYDCYDMNANRNVGYELDQGAYTVSLRRNSHVVDTCDDANISYSIGSTIVYRNDPDTGNRVTNRFTKYYDLTSSGTNTINAYANCSIDGSDSTGGSVVYLSRKDFRGTFPATTAKAVSGPAVSAAGNYTTDKTDVNVMPSQASDDSAKSLLLLTNENGTALSLAQLQGKATATFKYNDPLIQKLGSNYDDPAWDALLSQMTVDEIERLIECGGYHTEGIQSIGKPLVLENDGPTGLNRTNQGVAMSDEDLANMKAGWTSFPMCTVLAQTWNVRLAYLFGLSVANEGTKTGVYGWYAPGMNMHRSPFGGRNTEYYSEDPFLSGMFGAYSCQGAIANGMNVYLKHFVANETETNRGGLYTWMSEQALRETYLKPFEIAIKVGKANGLMSSFNRLGGTWSGANYALMTEVVRNEWGFRGAVITDWTSSGSGYTSLERGVRAGNDLWLNPGSMLNSLNKSDPTSVSCARKSAKNIIYSWCNSYYIAKNWNYDSADSQFVANVGDLIVTAKPVNYLTYVVIGINAFAFIGAGVWTFFLFRKKKDKKSAGSSDGNGPETNGKVV